MNKIKVSLDYNTITVKQYVDFISNEGNEVGQVSAILGQSKDFVRQLAPDQLQNAINAFKSVIEQPQANKQIGIICATAQAFEVYLTTGDNPYKDAIMDGKLSNADDLPF